jgi:hypothetical protein
MLLSEEDKIHANSKYDSKKALKIATLISEGNTYKDCAMIAGISEQTFYNWRNSIPAFCSLIDSARAEYFVNLRKTAYQGAKKDPMLAIKVLDKEGQYTESTSDHIVIEFVDDND